MGAFAPIPILEKKGREKFNPREVKTNIVWFRNDIRLHDNPAVAAAQAEKKPWVGVWVYSPELRPGNLNPFGDPVVSPQQTQARNKGLEELALRLRERGGLLVTSHPSEERSPEVILSTLAQALESERVFSATEGGRWEQREMSRTAKALRQQDCQLIWTRARTALEPLAPASCPDVFTPFSRKIKGANPDGARPLGEPKEIFGPSEEARNIARSILPEPKSAESGESGSQDPADGETQALKELTVWINGGLGRYKSTRNRLEGGSSLLSTALSIGTLSARTAFAKAEEKIRARAVAWEEGTKFLSELLWRDFFLHMGLKHGAKLYLHRGITGASRRKPTRDAAKLESWKNGTTGQNLVDAFMRELKTTGFMSNRGRQIVASYLINELGQPWEDGAWWFQSTLEDHSPTQNWGNWLHASGNGTDPVPDRRFNPNLQAERFDPSGEFRRKWLS